MYIKKKTERGVGSQPGLPGSLGFRVDQVSPSQLPSRFLLRPGPVPGPDGPGLESTRQAGPGFKTMKRRTSSPNFYKGDQCQILSIEHKRRKQS
jgi:hypothetical protein